MIRGIGPVYARKLVRAFGDKVFEIIEAELERPRGDRHRFRFDYGFSHRQPIDVEGRQFLLDITIYYGFLELDHELTNSKKRGGLTSSPFFVDELVFEPRRF